MQYCPVCGKEHPQAVVCDRCGFDLSGDYERYRTLVSALPEEAKPVSVYRAEWQASAGKKAGRRSPVPAPGRRILQEETPLPEIMFVPNETPERDGKTVPDEKTAPDTLRFTLNRDRESYSVAGVGTVTDTVIAVPAVYAGLPVTGIGDGAFAFCKKLTGVMLPQGIRSIGDRAFYECKKLKTVLLPEGVTDIGTSAFCACKKLESILLPKSVKSVGGWAFFRCNGLSRVFYGGDERDWERIRIGAYNSPLTEAEREWLVAGH